MRMIADRIDALLADKGYDSDAVRDTLASMNVEAVIPARRNRRNPAAHDRVKYRWRNQIERLFNKLKNWRRVATRYDKTTQSYIGFVSLASVLLWLPFVHDAYEAICKAWQNEPDRFTSSSHHQIPGSNTYRASGLNLLVAAIILWNTRCLEQAIPGMAVPPEAARHIAPLGWEHISLTGDYRWNPDDRPLAGQLRPLRTPASLLAA